MKKNDVIQFIEGHKWVGCFGFVHEVKPEKIMVGVPVPQGGIAYIFCQENEIEKVGEAVLVTGE